MQPARRAAFSLFELLVILALLGLLMALLLPAVAKVRSAANRTRSANNMKQIGLAIHSYHDTNGALPPGNDDQNFSAAARILPFVEEGALFNTIDFKKPINDDANRAASNTNVIVFVSPNDPLGRVNDNTAATNYPLCAGSKYALENNDGLFYTNSKVRFGEVADGLSNTIMSGETLKGDGGTKAVDVRRQHVLLKKDSLGDLSDTSGVKDFADNTNITGSRGAAWMDGRFLQGTFTGTRVMNDSKPDVSCDGLGGLSGLRAFGTVVNVGMSDGSVRALTENLDLNMWKAMSSRNGNEVVQIP